MAGRLLDRISEKIFWFLYYFARASGILVFSVRKHPETATWRIKRCSNLYIRCCVFIRIFGVAVTTYASLLFWITRDVILHSLENIALFGVVISSLGIITGQLYFLDHIVAWTRRLFRLHHRIQGVAPRRLHFIDGSFFALLTAKFLSSLYDVVSYFPHMFCNLSVIGVLDTILGNMYLSIGVGMTLHITCIVYLVLGQLYSVLNRTICEHLRPRLRVLNINKGGQKQLQQLRRELEHFIEVYNEVYKVGEEFQRLFQIPISYTLLTGFASVTITLYHVTWLLMTKAQFDWQSSLFSAKLFIDVLLLTLAAHRVVKASQVTKRCGLDTVCVLSDREWDRTVDVFLNRLNFYEFKPNLLGLLDISNELNLMFLSAAVTYMTFIIQYSLNNEPTAVELYETQ